MTMHQAVHASAMIPGKYFVGDLCYVIDKQWDEVCDLLCGANFNGGQFVLADGTPFALYGTAHGDGTYLDEQSREYSVDAGVLGCILVDRLAVPITDHVLKLGHVIDFPEPFHTGRDSDGKITLGHVTIDTNPPAEEEEPDEEPDEEVDEDDESDVWGGGDW